MITSLLTHWLEVVNVKLYGKVIGAVVVLLSASVTEVFPADAVLFIPITTDLAHAIVVPVMSTVAV